jgi:prepilin-type N-terminal cleavage/methylation domain-containing protein
MYTKRKARGFTLIELLVVIAIIGILASIVLVSLTSARAKARDARRVSDLVQIGKFMAVNADPEVLLGGGGVASLTDPYVEVRLVSTPAGFSQFYDPQAILAGPSKTPECQGASATPSTALCNYSFSTFLGNPRASTRNYQACAWLESNYGPRASGATGGLISVSDESSGTPIAGCL